jgi:hypothetical protein
MKQKVKRLIQDLRECSDLLQHHGEASWANRLKSDLKRIEKRGRKALGDDLAILDHELTTLTISHDSGHLVNPVHETEVNNALETYRRSLRAGCSEIMAGCGR